MTTEAAAILGIDTATADVAVAVTRAGELVWEASEPPGETGRPRHAETLLAVVERALEAAGGWDAIGTIGLGVGPGSFTGLRVGVSTGRALAQAKGLEIAPIGSLAALARGIPERGGRRGLALIDARRDELFAALYDDGDEPIWEPFVAAPEAIGERAAGLGARPRAAGDGSLRFRHRLEAAGVEVLPDTDQAHRMAARHVCALAERAPRLRPEQVTPIYLRRPDAEVWREQRNGQPARGG
ncbi:MAG: tRNA (adenosine(37)-N6)-threonylcarbamoyltransferase complex dimerization subunit type 1 TsaB [Solirubrobacterales bacterium]